MTLDSFRNRHWSTCVTCTYSTICVWQKKRCICKVGYCLAIPVVGTIITAIIGLAITITAESVLIAILIGLVILFLTMTILNLLRLVLCLVYEHCECR